MSAAAPLAPKVALGAASVSVPEYLLTRLQQHGVKHLFGVPGATCDALFAAAAATLDVVVTTSDLDAGYAADAYARVKGLSAVSVTYGVGTLSLIAPIAGAFVERSPVVVINGGPSAEDLRIQKEFGSLFSHSNGKEKSDLTMFREVTAYAGRAATPEEVPKVVDAALTAALTQRRPVYIEIAKHLWDAKCAPPGEPLNVTVAASGQEAQVAAKIQSALVGAKRPAVLVGIEVQRFGLAEQVTKFLAATGLPWATTFLAKGTLSEKTPGFVGVYGGERSSPETKKVIEEADLLLALGPVLGRQYRRLATKGTLIVAADGAVRIGKQATNAPLSHLVSALSSLTWAKTSSPSMADLSFEGRRASLKSSPKTGKALSYDEVLGAVSKSLDENSFVVTDTSLSMYPAAELDLSRGSSFMCNAVWQAIGFSVGASVGVSIAGGRRPLVICGDGGFQMTAQALSTMARRQLPCTVLVLDNAIYGIEQFLLDASFFKDANKPPKKYLELNAWKYTQLANAFGVQNTAAVATVEQLATALTAAKTAKGPTLIQVALSPRDLPAGLS
ncbi:MAG: thiamine pyrophosphate-dependent enzyme [Archangium sp.]